MGHIKIMGHLVAGFPDMKGFEAACRGMADGGVEILEIQIPFSDPTADGPLNTAASEYSLRNGFRVNDIFSCIRFARDIGFEEIHVMTYANIAFRMGIHNLISSMEDEGVTGLIVPDLPLEDEEGLYAETAGRMIDAVPVVVVHMLPERVALLKTLNTRRCYVSLRQGVTGQETELQAGDLDFLDSLGIPLLYGGFGIQSAGQVAALEGHVHAAVVGSFFTRLITDAAGITGEAGIYQGAEEPAASWARDERIYEQVKSGAASLRPGK